MPEAPTFGRYAEIPYDQMTPEQQEGYRSLMEVRGRLPGPNKIYVHNPKLVKVMGPLGAYFRTGYSLSEREREIAVVIINSKWHSIYPTNAHERAGKCPGSQWTPRWREMDSNHRYPAKETTLVGHRQVTLLAPVTHGVSSLLCAQGDISILRRHGRSGVCSLGPRPDIPRYAFSLPAAGGVVTRRGAIGAAGMLLTSISGIGRSRKPRTALASSL